MKVKVLKLGEAAKEVEIQDGATLQHVIQASGFNREHMTVTLNRHPPFDTSPVDFENQFNYINSCPLKRGKIRHTFASHLIPVIQELLGHSDITTTMIYAHLSPDIHKKEIAKLPF